MKRRLALLAAGVVAVLLLIGSNAERLYMDYLVARSPAAPIAERETLIGPALQYFPPADKAPPWPVVMQFHGCGGMRQPFQEQWARVANEEGYLAVIVDSHGPRGIAREEALETVCKGKTLIGQERAGDMLAAYGIVRRRDDVDSERIVVTAWSHGAWTAMDFLTMNAAGQRPQGVAASTEGATEIAGFVGFYPYCGPGARARFSKWPAALPSLFFVAGADTIVDGSQCRRLAERVERKGATLDLEYYPDAEHVFDDPFLREDYPQFYDADTHADAEAKYRAFLREIAAADAG